jgi:hypothetical protein
LVNFFILRLCGFDKSPDNVESGGYITLNNVGVFFFSMKPTLSLSLCKFERLQYELYQPALSTLFYLEIAAVVGI